MCAVPIHLGSPSIHGKRKINWKELLFAQQKHINQVQFSSSSSLRYSLNATGTFPQFVIALSLFKLVALELPFYISGLQSLTRLLAILLENEFSCQLQFFQSIESQLNLIVAKLKTIDHLILLPEHRNRLFSQLPSLK